jgi:hypothetical protein
MVAAKPRHENSLYSLRGRRYDSAVLIFLADIDGPLSEAGELHYLYSAAVVERFECGDGYGWVVGLGRSFLDGSDAEGFGRRTVSSIPSH